MEWLQDIWAFISGMIAEFTAFCSLVILVVLFFMLDFKFLVRSFAMLRSLFKVQDVTLAVLVTVPWRIRKQTKGEKETRYRYIKAFCEFAIFESKGEKLSFKEWAMLEHKFFYEQMLADPFLISVDSTFEILNSKVDAQICNYFDYLNKQPKALMHNRKKSKFVCRLRFENGFVYPATFINGLERKFANSWTDLLVKYNYTLKNAKYHNSKQSSSIIKSMTESENQLFMTSQNYNAFNLKSNELFMVYSWLMWSPSYQMNFKDDRSKVILYGIGDESNTVNLILDTSENSQALWQQLKDCMARNVFGFNLSIECDLYELEPYIHENIQNFSVEAMPLINNLVNNSNDFRYILSYVSPASDASLKNTVLVEDNDAFFSGYLWTLYGRVKQDDDMFDIKNSVAFFEHSNLADSTSVEYFTKALAQKTILHFKTILDTDKPDTYYLDCCMAQGFKDEYIRLVREYLDKEDKDFVEKFDKYIHLTGSSVTINEILENIDEEFPMNQLEFRRATTPKEIGEFYASIYVNNFAPDERDSIDDLIERTINLKSENHHDIVLAYQNGELAGGVVFDWFKKSNCGMIEYIVVDSKYRGMRIAKRLVSVATAYMTHYAGNKRLNGIFIEIEDPEKFEQLDAQAALDNYRRLQLWSRSKYNRVDINYIQPALGEGLSKLDNLMLAVNTLNSDANYIDAEVLIQFLIDFNTICNRIEDINDPDAGVKDMIDEIKSKPDGKVAILQNSIVYEKYKPKSIGR